MNIVGVETQTRPESGQRLFFKQFADGSAARIGQAEYTRLVRQLVSRLVK